MPTGRSLEHVIPQELLRFMTAAKHLQLERKPVLALDNPGHRQMRSLLTFPTVAQVAGTLRSSNSPLQYELHGMSLKKSHEVARMTSYIVNLMSEQRFQDIRHVVDIGAGQVGASFRIFIYHRVSRAACAVDIAS